jgi:catechol 2,3-dioxygenase-like lactoylglutathione lyase family enzyme
MGVEIKPKTINHVGISVTNLEKAIKFYTETFGFRVLSRDNVDTDRSSTMNDLIFKDIFKGLLKEVNAAWLVSGNGIGLEIFEFINPRSEQPADIFENWKKHFSHICITDPNIEELCEKIKLNGGIKHSEYWYPFKDKNHRLVYCKDPFGNFIEIFTHDYEKFILDK